jgi:hypothetical protein
MVVNNWDVFIHDPIPLEGCCKKSTFGNTHLSYTGGSVGEVSHEDALELLAVDFFTENDGKISDKFENTHSNSPLSVFSHIS